MLGVSLGCAEPELEALVESVLVECHKIASVRYVYGLFDIERVTENCITLKGSSFTLQGKDICEHLAGCDTCALMAVTLGAAVDAALLRYQRTDMTRAVVLDAAASVIADAAADECEEKILAQAKSLGKKITTRYSPGYGDFPIECQREFLNALNCGVRLGLTVTDSCMLLPSKSITACVGAG